MQVLSSEGSPPAAPNPVLSVATRSGRVESWHRGAVAVVHDDATALTVGEAELPVFARSAVKPFQALPLLERGLHRQLGIPAAEIAVMCASHEGTEEHVRAVRSLLARGGLDERLLGCGPHAPFDKASRLALMQRDQRPAKVHNNCSGKHAGFLLLAQAIGDDPAAYLDADSAAQREVQQAVARMAGLGAPLPTGLDGCGAPTFVLPLTALARAFCRLASCRAPNRGALPTVGRDACATILDAVGEHPTLLAGEQRLCTALVRTWPGRCFAKNGAEGVYAVALAPDPMRARWPGALGLAVKVDDGAERGYLPVVVDLLRWLGAFPGDSVPASLQRFWRPSLQNTQQKVVGDVQCVLSWRTAGGAR